MVHIELSSRGRDTIALEMPDISYFSTNRSRGLEENCWEAENKLLTYRICDFRCRDFNVTRYQIYCKEDCCMRSLNGGFVGTLYGVLRECLFAIRQEGDFLYRSQESLDSNRFICGVE